ncbi:MAG TPA: ABC-F family ATP-binding cassette domain-containing protein [Bacillota bacterium]|nr:ABC-F family ATP-binding cassette domain-containing protein [Bacillota bacterium]
MMIMQLNGISKSFAGDRILNNIKLDIKDQDRIAIVGRNGSGKSTLLKIMAGELSYDSGELIKPKNLSIGYLSQHNGLESNLSIWEEMMEVFADLTEMERSLRLMEEKMADAATLSSAAYKKLLHDYDRLQQAFERNGGYHYEADIKAVLSGLNFDNYADDTPIRELSGGQKTRLALGKLLLQKPDLLILDEPTNHLDIDTLSWLESYLANYPGALVIVSHDRYFLDKTVSIVYEISRCKGKKYYGDYTAFLEQKALDYERELKAYEKQQSEMKRMEDFIQKNIARAATTKRAQSRRKQLAKMERLEKPLGEEATATFAFQMNKQSGNDVLKLENVAFQYDQTSDMLFKNINLHIHRGERIALIGPNGVGKTTLLKVILGKLQPTKGHIQYGTNVQIGYYDQEQKNLISTKTVLHELWDDYPTINEKEIRTVLGQFLFSGTDVLKHVHDLSGGEKARLALAKLMMQKANLLILDEPTNHLDLASKEVLEAALINFPGTIIFVSHDRYFINKIADRVVEIQPGGAAVYLGNYDYVMEKKQEEAELKQLDQTEEKPMIQTDDNRRRFEEEKRQQSKERKRKRRIKNLEETIEKLELERAQLEEKMAEPAVYQDYKKAWEYTAETNKIKQKIEQLMEEWLALADE